MKNRKLKEIWPCLCLPALLMVCAVVFVAINNQPKSLFHFDPSEIDQVALRGNSVILDISEREEVDEIISLLNEFRYHEREAMPPAMGWDYAISFTAGEEDFWIVFTADIARVSNLEGGSTFYYGPPGYFRPLVDRIDEARPH